MTPAPLADVAALLVREKLTGRAAPGSAQTIMDALREDMEERAAGSLEAIAKAVDLDDQEAFAELARAFIRDLDLEDNEQGRRKD